VPQLSKVNEPSLQTGLPGIGSSAAETVLTEGELPPAQKFFVELAEIRWISSVFCPKMI